jgi:hypothetical protein
MSETEQELWRAVDSAIFKTEDPAEIRKRFASSYEAFRSRQSTLGGYLSTIRRGRELSAGECAGQVGVPREKWQAWEADHAIPTELELEQLIEKMGFGEKKREKLYRLKGKAPRLHLTRLTNFRPELLAARGVAMVEPDLEWEALPDEVKALLMNWSVSRGIETPEELFSYLETLETDEQRADWIESVLAEPGEPR